VQKKRSIYRRRVTTATMFCLIKTTQPHHLQLDRKSHNQKIDQKNKRQIHFNKNKDFKTNNL
jgi:hypothetical protein